MNLPVLQKPVVGKPNTKLRRHRKGLIRKTTVPGTGTGQILYHPSTASGESLGALDRTRSEQEANLTPYRLYILCERSIIPVRVVGYLVL